MVVCRLVRHGVKPLAGICYQSASGESMENLCNGNVTCKSIVQGLICAADKLDNIESSMSGDSNVMGFEE